MPVSPQPPSYLFHGAHGQSGLVLMCAASVAAPCFTLSLTLNWNLSQAAWSPSEALLRHLTLSHLQPLGLLSSTSHLL